MKKLMEMERTEFNKFMKEQYPKIYQGIGGNPSKTCMAFGLEIGRGWRPLVYKLSSSLDFNEMENGWPGVIALQVKEKFGGLRWYYSIRDDSPRLPPLWKDILMSTIGILKKKSKYIRKLYYGHRFRRDWYRDQGRISGMINFAEVMSFAICESCGTTKDVEQRGGNWITTLCPKCLKRKKSDWAH